MGGEAQKKTRHMIDLKNLTTVPVVNSMVASKKRTSVFLVLVGLSLTGRVHGLQLNDTGIGSYEWGNWPSNTRKPNRVLLFLTCVCNEQRLHPVIFSRDHDSSRLDHRMIKDWINHTLLHTNAISCCYHREIAYRVPRRICALSFPMFHLIGSPKGNLEFCSHSFLHRIFPFIGALHIRGINPCMLVSLRSGL